MKSREKHLRILYFSLSLLVVVIIGLVIHYFQVGGGDGKAVKAGGILIGSSDDRGWNESHCQGLISSCEKLSCSYQFKDNVPEEEAALREAVSELVTSGCNVIFLTSSGYGEYADAIAMEYPEVAFYTITGEGEAKNCTSFFARIYQVRYLSGIVAGATSRTGVLGYVAALPISETNRSINAFTLGARKVNPDARVLVRFTGSWNNEKKEILSVKQLADAGADLMTFHEDTPRVIETAEEMGLFSIGYDAVYADYSEKFLTAALFNWDLVYEKLLGDYLSGRANFSKSYWLGLKDEGVMLYPFSKLVDKTTIALVEEEKERIQTWQDVFSGEIRDNTGVLRCEENECISDEELFNGMNWFAEGVEVYE